MPAFSAEQQFFLEEKLELAIRGDPCPVMTLRVFDATESKPKPKPLKNVRIVVENEEYYTDENGTAKFFIVPGQKIRIEKEKYKSLEIRAVDGEKAVFMHSAYGYGRHILAGGLSRITN